MCGIFGLINKDSSAIDQETVINATQKLSHRGPDDEGFYYQENIGFGHQRLSIIDLSNNAHQPFKQHGYVMVYNGEIYNYIEIRNELITHGYKFKSTSDTEVILSSYDYWGSEMFSKFNGMWALAIYDEAKKEIILSRDRYGMKPLYIYNTPDQFSFASEIKAFSKLSEWTGNLNKNSVFDFLSSGEIYHNKNTFYENVTMLEPATYSIYEDTGELIKTDSFYTINSTPANDKNIDLKYRDLFSKAIKAHYISDVEVACALSGGLDSSSIVAESIKQKKEIKTFSYAPTEVEFNEYRYVEELKEKYEFQNFKVSPGIKEHLDAHHSAIESNEAPLLSISYISSFLLYQKVSSKGIKVLLAGQGADELLLGYNFYYLPFLKYLKKTKPFLFIRETISLTMKYPSQVLKSLFRGRGYNYYGQYIKSGITTSKKTENISLKELYEENLYSGHLHSLLQFEDRVSMAHSVEGRLPFLDRDFSNFLHSIPLHKKIVRAIKKMPLRKAMTGIVPEQILKRKDKLGFLSPQEKWIFDHQELFMTKIETGVGAHSEWFEENMMSFIQRAFDEKKHHSFIWRLYSFLEFMEVKL